YLVSDGSGSPAIVAGSPADKAGLKEGDIITKVNSTAIDNTHSLTGVLAQFNPGDQVTLTVIRGGKTMNIQATLGTAPTG
ncbi:MAG TPA: PDZ domain-containing protein, partial [Candidatus Nitrosopolaris sp.]|nr:PDZ domain-containing protein [Candidatus Nitrosopolaris sp.]